MSKFSKGQFSQLPLRGKDEHGRGWLGVGVCAACSSTVNVKINRSGWPYYFCQNSDCKDERAAHGQKSAAAIVSRMLKFHRGCQRKAQILAGLRKRPAAKDDHEQPPTTAPDSDPLETAADDLPVTGPPTVPLQIDREISHEEKDKPSRYNKILGVKFRK